MNDGVWGEAQCLAFMARALPEMAVSDVRSLAGGYWNDVLRLTTQDGPLVLKHYRGVMPGTLFPNRPQDEARALDRLQGLAVAPEPLGFWADQKVLVYRYVVGEPWDRDVVAVASLLRRKRSADASGFRAVPATVAGVLEQGAALFADCRSDARVAALLAVRPAVRVVQASAPVLLHTDIGAMNLIGAGAGLRLIDWQCPAVGDEAEDVASFLSPAFQILNHRAPLSVTERAAFMDALADAALEQRLAVLEPAYAWRMAAYCCRRIDTAADDAVVRRYAQAADAELARLREWRN